MSTRLSMDKRKLQELRRLLGYDDELLEQVLRVALSAEKEAQGMGLRYKEAAPAGPLPLGDLFDAVFGGTTPDDHRFQGEDWS